MPTYDYICDSCKHEFEAYESIKSDPQTLCPKCREKTEAEDRSRRGDLVQGVGLLSNRLSQRFLQEKRQGRQTAGIRFDFDLNLVDVLGQNLFVHVFVVDLNVEQIVRRRRFLLKQIVRQRWFLKFQKRGFSTIMIVVRCPICAKSFEIDSLDDLPSFPFCSARCKLIDLGRWLDGAYLLPGKDCAGIGGGGDR